MAPRTRSNRTFRYPVSFYIACGLATACSTTQVQAPPPPTPPSYVSVPHPSGSDVGDLIAVFQEQGAPKDAEFSKTCDQDFQKLNASTKSRQELASGVSELVKRDPVQYHWCFYGKLLSLENEMMKDTYVEERQKAALDTYEFLVPVARAFAREYHDSRYLRWATLRYKKLSEWIFYRRLDLTPAGTEELVQVSNPFGLWRESTKGPSVLEKYHIVDEPLPVIDANEAKKPEAAAKK